MKKTNITCKLRVITTWTIINISTLTLYGVFGVWGIWAMQIFLCYTLKNIHNIKLWGPSIRPIRLHKTSLFSSKIIGLGFSQSDRLVYVQPMIPSPTRPTAILDCWEGSFSQSTKEAMCTSRVNDFSQYEQLNKMACTSMFGITHDIALFSINWIDIDIKDSQFCNK